jgi:Helix-turn-helix domain
MEQVKMTGNRKQTAQQRLNNFLRSDLAKTYPLCTIKRMVLHALASYCYYKNECNPSLPTLAEYCQLKDPEKMSKHLDALQSLGLIEITRVKGKTNNYKWLVPEIDSGEIYSKWL